MESTSIDLDSYLTYLGLEEFKLNRPEPTLDTLSKLTAQHATKFLYHVIDLQIKYVRGQPIEKEDLSIPFIQKKLINEKRGGMCYEINLLMEAALVAFGFKVQFLTAFPAPFLPERQTSHVCLLVKIDADYYLVDPGFAFNNLRAPIKFDFEVPQETTVFGYENYQIAIESNYYQVNLSIEDKVLPMFYFMREGSSPKISDRERIIEEYIAFMNSEQEFRARDFALFLGGATPDGRVVYWWDKKLNSGYRFKQVNCLPEKEKTDFTDFESFQKAATETLGFEIPSELQKISVRPKV